MLETEDEMIAFFDSIHRGLRCVPRDEKCETMRYATGFTYVAWGELTRYYFERDDLVRSTKNTYKDVDGFDDAVEWLDG